MKPSKEFTYVFLACVTFVGIMLIYKILAASMVTRSAMLNWDIPF